MRKLLFAAIATLAVAVGTLAFSGAASAESSNGSHPHSPSLDSFVYTPIGG